MSLNKNIDSYLNFSKSRTDNAVEGGISGVIKGTKLGAGLGAGLGLGGSLLNATLAKSAGFKIPAGQFALLGGLGAATGALGGALFGAQVGGVVGLLLGAIKKTDVKDESYYVVKNDRVIKEFKNKDAANHYSKIHAGSYVNKGSTLKDKVGK